MLSTISLLRIVTGLLLLGLLAPGLAGAATPPNPGNFDNVVAPGVYRLDGTDPELPLGDFAPLRRIVGSATFVGLGESTHTSGGFYEVKHRLIRYLVEAVGGSLPIVPRKHFDALVFLEVSRKMEPLAWPSCE